MLYYISYCLSDNNFVNIRIEQPKRRLEAGEVIENMPVNTVKRIKIVPKKGTVEKKYTSTQEPEAPNDISDTRDSRPNLVYFNYMPKRSATFPSSNSPRASTSQCIASPVNELQSDFATTSSTAPTILKTPTNTRELVHQTPTSAPTYFDSTSTSTSPQNISHAAQSKILFFV